MEAKLTKEEVLAMRPSVKFDALVAEKVFGLPALTLKDAPCPNCNSEMRFCGARSWCGQCNEWAYSPYKDYSGDIAAAWEVVERLQSLLPGGDIHIEHLNGFWNVSTCYRDSEWKKWTEAATAPEAICKAALLAVMADAVKVKN